MTTSGMVERPLERPDDLCAVNRSTRPMYLSPTPRRHRVMSLAIGESGYQKENILVEPVLISVLISVQVKLWRCVR